MTGTLRRNNPTTLDANGDQIHVTATSYSVEGIRDGFNAFYAQVNGIPQTDVKILLIMKLIKPATEPRQDDMVLMRGQWYKVRRVLDIDPANASIVLQCFSIDTPV